MTTLAQMPTGGRGFVACVQVAGSAGERLLEMGLTPGAPVRVLRRTGGALQLQVRDYSLSLGLQHAQQVVWTQQPQVPSTMQSLRKESGLSSSLVGQSRQELPSTSEADPQAALEELPAIALLGNPNSGKTTLFNQLTGELAKVGNYPGVTVEERRAFGKLPSGKKVHFIDCPGSYSITARSREEMVVHDVLMGAMDGAPPAVVVVILDACNLQRNLYICTQLLELPLRVVVALNMMDEAREAGISIDCNALEQALGVPVAPIIAKSGEGCDALLHVLQEQLASPPRAGALFAMEQSHLQELTAVAEKISEGDSVLSLGETLWQLTSCTSTSGEQGKEPAFLAETLARLGGSLFVRQMIERRYGVVDEICRQVVQQKKVQQSFSEKADAVLLHRIFGLPIFAAVVFLLFQAVFSWAAPVMEVVDFSMGAVATWVQAILPAGILQAMITEGAIAGVGNVLIFLPQIVILFLILSFLEDVGYLARAATLVDRTMSRVGLSGQAFIPMMSSFACAVPGIMAARSVEQPKDRLVTVLVAPLMSCSARLPVYTLVIAALFSAYEPLWGFLSVGGILIAAMYLLGIAAAVFVAFLLKRSVLRSPTPSLLIELPPYRLPTVRKVVRSTYERAQLFVIRTGPVILALSLVLWAALTFPQQGLSEAELGGRKAAIEAQGLEPAAKKRAYAALANEDRQVQLAGSVGGQVGHFLEPVIAPLGFDWKIGIGLVASFAAREVLVSTLGQIYGLGAAEDENSVSLREALLRERNKHSGASTFTPLVGISLMVFFVLACQCLSTVAVVRRETNSWRWPLFMIAYMNALAWVASFVVFQGGRLLGFG